MSGLKKTLGIAAGSYAVGLVVYWVTSPYIAIAVPAVGLLVALSLRQRSRKEIDQRTQGPELQQGQQNPPLQQTIAGTGAPAPQAAPAAPAVDAAPVITDPELASALEYIGIIEDMILLEGKQNNLDDEIVQKTLALLARLNRLIPDLVALGDASINHNIVRLVRRDLNSTINPFLRLSGEAKRQNRRLLLDGIKDVDSKLTFYTKTIEQKDLMELRTKAELIQQRYRLSD
ncbi:hypothetical protein FHS16_004205 [Paenibacillus endophyticus]|uniref:5-bromo-4-chloroindolyl phosphate hydrolysis protein n=1 Tax=Paenibacillus endophyticus TaxID=1294268 RepID=A0A7W5CC71_9BACL|nr:hypothetical protein [Paenibacillus endophyticus]MBB3154129.1 hypothetical protein [Paenibacillus endophyticus]